MLLALSRYNIISGLCSQPVKIILNTNYDSGTKEDMNLRIRKNYVFIERVEIVITYPCINNYNKSTKSHIIKLISNNKIDIILLRHVYHQTKSLLVYFSRYTSFEALYVVIVKIICFFIPLPVRNNNMQTTFKQY